MAFRIKAISLSLLLMLVLIHSFSNAAYIWNTSTLDNLGSSGKYASSSVLSDGRYCVSYFSSGRLRFAESFKYNNEIRWHRKYIDTDGVVGLFTSTAIRTVDRPSIAYYDLENGDLKVARREGSLWDDSWSISIVDSTDNAGTHPSISIAPDGHEAIAYLSISPDDIIVSLKYAHYNGFSWNMETIPVSNIDRESDVCLRFAPDGLPAIVFHQLSSSCPVYVKFDGFDWETSVIDDTITGGRDPSLVFLPDGNPAAAYHVEYNPLSDSYNDLRYSYFDGAEWIHEEVATGSGNHDDLGYFSSMIIDSEGSPIVAFYERGNTAVQFAYKEGTEWKVEVPQLKGLVGSYCSVVIGIDDLPVVFFYNMGWTTLLWSQSTRQPDPEIRITGIRRADDGTEDILLSFEATLSYRNDIYYSDTPPAEEPEWILAESDIDPAFEWRDNGDSRTGFVHPSQVIIRCYRIISYEAE